MSGKLTSEVRHASAASPRLAGIDSLRGVAAFAVLVCHAQAYCLIAGRPLPWPLPQVLNNGAHGVDLFIVVSGFCLAIPVVRGQGLVVRNFYIRRAFRLLPAYYVGLFVASVLAVPTATAALVVGPPADAVDVVLHALLLQSVAPGHIATINGSLWSVALEVQLYLVFPLTLAIYRRLGSALTILATALLSVTWGALSAFQIGTLGDGHLLPARLVQFVAGMWVADRVVRGQRSTPGRLWGVVLVGGLAGLVVSTVDIGMLDPVIWAVPSAALLMALTHLAPSLLVPFERFGVITYSFYLLHQPVLLLIAPALRKVTGSPFGLLLLGVVVGWGITTALATVLYRWVEQPSQEYARRWSITRRGVGVVAPGNTLRTM